MGEGAECEGRELVGVGMCSDDVGVPGVGVDSGCTLACLVTCVALVWRSVFPPCFNIYNRYLYV